MSGSPPPDRSGLSRTTSGLWVRLRPAPDSSSQSSRHRQSRKTDRSSLPTNAPNRLRINHLLSVPFRFTSEPGMRPGPASAEPPRTVTGARRKRRMKPLRKLSAHLPPTVLAPQVPVSTKNRGNPQDILCKAMRGLIACPSEIFDLQHFVGDTAADFGIQPAPIGAAGYGCRVRPQRR